MFSVCHQWYYKLEYFSTPLFEAAVHLFLLFIAKVVLGSVAGDDVLASDCFRLFWLVLLCPLGVSCDTSVKSSVTNNNLCLTHWIKGQTMAF